MATKAAKAAAGGLKAWLMPEINDIKVSLAEMRGDVRSLAARVDATNERIDSTNDRIDSLRNELKSEISLVSSKVDEMDKRLTSEIQGVKDSLNIVQRLSVLEAKQREFERKSS